MPHEIIIPRLGWSMDEGTLARWLVQPGETVRAGQPVFELEVEKATQEIEATADGIVYLPPDSPAPGSVVAVGAVIGYLLVPGEAPPTASGPHAASPAAAADTDERRPTAAAASSSQETAPPHGQRISPRAARLAAELGVDTSAVRGSGTSGRIRERDVRTAGRRNSPNVQSRAGTSNGKLTGLVSLVTGAARGIGQSIADRLAAAGSTVIYSDIDAAGAETAARTGGGHARRLDVTNAGEINEVVDGIVREFGRLDVLVNNAGINTLAHRVPIDQFPREEWDRILAVDLTGVYEVSRAAAAVMRRAGGGRIINVASIVGLVPLRLQCAYIAAKAGVVNLTKAMALELASAGILVNAVAPGSTLTEGTRQLFYGPDGKFSDKAQRMIDHVPLGRPGRPEEIAVAVEFLADPENTYMTGHVLVVDGGWIAGYARDF